MNATERAAMLHGLEVYDDLNSAVDERTIEIVERRRRTSVVKGRGWLVRRVLLGADLVGLLLSALLAEWAVDTHQGRGVLSAPTEFIVFAASLPAWIVIAKLYGLYDHDEERTDHSTADDFPGVFHMVTVFVWLFWAGTHVSGLAHPSPSKLFIFWAAAVVLISTGRALARSLARRSAAYVQNAVIVGAGDVGQLIAKKLLGHPEYGIHLVGFVDARPKERRADLLHLALLGDTDRLAAIVRLFHIERVIIAFSNESHERTIDLIRSVKDLDVQVDLVPRFFEVVSPGIGIHTIEGVPLVSLPPLRLSRSSRFIKRCVDLTGSTVALVLLAPLFAAVALAIKLDSPGPVFFRQIRMGAANETFRIFKFRSMAADAESRKSQVAHLNKHLNAGGDPRMFKISGDPRVTRVGRWLRRFSLDELPQLFNVLLADMSLVGPRPLILDEDRHVQDWARRRLDLKPGITGLWQVTGRDDIPFAEMTRLDYLYVTSWTLWRDLQLMLRTVPCLLRSSGS
jgi:exopolysaccharide biosynthesis polyprenyl glycosylphosphotransferase